MFSSGRIFYPCLLVLWSYKLTSSSCQGPIRSQSTSLRSSVSGVLKCNLLLVKSRSSLISISNVSYLYVCLWNAYLNQQGESTGSVVQSSTYDPFVTSAASLSLNNNISHQVQNNPYASDSGISGGSAYFQTQTSYVQPVTSPNPMRWYAMES